MKKLLALLLALLLPVSGLAETHTFNLSIDVDDELFPQQMKQLLQSFLSMSDESLALCSQIVQKVVDGFAASMTTQEDAFAVDIQFAGQPLIDVTTYTKEDANYCVSSLMPGYAFVEGLAQSPETVHEEASIDWSAVAASASAAASQWRSNMEPFTNTGFYEDDAYAVKGKCTTWILGDQDIAALLSSVATKEVRNALTLVLDAMGEDAQSLLAQFDAKNASVADEDPYLYLLYIMENEAGEIAGISLDIYGETATELLASISLGLEDKIEMVLGLGLNRDNYWWQVSADIQQHGDITAVNGITREWLGDKGMAFKTVTETYKPIYDAKWRCDITANENQLSWKGELASNDEAKRVLLSTEGNWFAETHTFEGCICLGPVDSAALTTTLSYRPDQALPQLPDNLVACSATDPADEGQYNELMDQLANKFAARLLKLLPLDLLMTLDQQLSMP